MNKVVYIFLDEGGNFDFSKNGTKYFCLTALYTTRPFDFCNDFYELKHDIIETSPEIDIEYFHCSEDNYRTRDEVFQLIEKHKRRIIASSIILEKQHIKPELQDFKHLYPYLISLFVTSLVEQNLLAGDTEMEMIFVTDAIPIKKKKQGIEKAIKESISHKLPATARYKILHHDSKSHMCLQIADYINWAIYRKVTTGSCDYFDRLKDIMTVKDLRNDPPN